MKVGNDTKIIEVNIQAGNNEDNIKHDDLNIKNTPATSENDTKIIEVKKLEDNNEEDIKIYFRSQMTNDFKLEEKILKKIINNDVKHHNQEKKIKFLIYYKNRKIKHMFIRNNITRRKEDCNVDYNVIYKYSCDKVPCNATQTCYIGHTTTTVKERIKQHSSIKRHHRETHKENITGSMILPNISILAKAPDKIDLILLEALLIKQHKPIINIQTDDFNRTLNIF